MRFAKESLGEYGSGWEWDEVWPRVFGYEQSFTHTDEYGQTYIEYYPARYINEVSKAKPSINGTWVDYGAITSIESSEKCQIETTSGEILNSESFAGGQVSCNPHVYNAGNYYNYPSSAPDSNKFDSVCPLGWRLPENGGETSYSNLLFAYSINYDTTGANRDSALLNLPFSFLRAGGYETSGVPYALGVVGYYRMSSRRLYIYWNGLSPTDYAYSNDGYSVRCVSR